MSPPLDDGGYLPAEAELEALVTAFPDVGFILNREGRYVEVLASPDTEDLLYDDPEALLGERIADVFDAEMAETFMAHVERALDTGDVQSFEYTLEVHEGTRWFEARVAPVTSGTDGEYVVYVARDVTGRKQSRRRLARRHGYMRQMLDSLDDVFYALDSDGRLVDWNHTVETVTGYDDDELADCAVYDIFGEDAGARLRAFVDEVVETGSARRVTEIRTRTGRTIPYEFVAGLFDDPGGDDLVVGIGRDVSERVEREEQVRVFGRVLRHNMRNKMTIIEGTAETLDRRADDDDITPEIARIQAASASLSRLTEKAHDATEILLAESRPEPVDLDAVAREVVEDCRRRHEAVEFRYDGAEAAVALAVPAVRDALAELLDNAVEHGAADARRQSGGAADGGMANADPGDSGAAAGDETGPASDPAVEVRLAVESRGDVVAVTVSDDGPGLPDHEANIITEEREMSPVFHASGMGLWLVRWIVRRSRGDVTLVEGADGGTAITIELSRVDGVDPPGTT